MLFASQALTQGAEAGLVGWQVGVQDTFNVAGRYLLVRLNGEAFPNCAGKEIPDTGEPTFERIPASTVFDGVAEHEPVGYKEFEANRNE